MYEDVPDVLRGLHASGLKIGLISNTQRSLTAFQTHFELEGLFCGAVSSSDHGYMKPHRSIFEAALQQVGVTPHEAVMVGDSLPPTSRARAGSGMRAVLVSRSGRPRHVDPCPADVPVIQIAARAAGHCSDAASGRSRRSTSAARSPRSSTPSGATPTPRTSSRRRC